MQSNREPNQDMKDQAYREAISKFTNMKGDVDIDTLRKILKAISALVNIKENDPPELDGENFYEQTEVKGPASNLFK